MKTIRRKGEKMSLRKGLTLLLLAAFGLSTVAPALAINVNQGVVFNTVAQDDGTASTGAKQDVVATNILFDSNIVTGKPKQTNNTENTTTQNNTNNRNNNST